MNKIVNILICFCLVYTPFFANAGAAEKWDLVENHYDDIGKNMSYTAKKVGSAVNDASYKAKVPVNAATLGSSVAMLIRGGLATAAVIALIEGVGWIIENGVVKKQDGEDEIDSGFEYVWFVNFGTTYTSATAAGLCKKSIGPNTSSYSYSKVELIDLNTADCYWIDTKGGLTGTAGKEFKNFRFNRIKNNKYDPTFKPRYVPVTDIDLGKKIIESPAAPQIIPDVYNPNQPTNTPAREASKEALDKALPDTDPATGESKPKPNTDTDGDGKPDTYDPTAPDAGSEFKFPPFCEIAPVMCVWYEKYSEDSKKADQQREDEKGFWQKIEDWFNWTKEEPDPPNNEDTEVEVNDLEIPDIDTSILQASGQCPADFSYAFPLPFGGTHTITYSYATVCYWFSKLYYIVITVAWVVAYKIVTGVGGTKDNG